MIRQQISGASRQTSGIISFTSRRAPLGGSDRLFPRLLHVAPVGGENRTWCGAQHCAGLDEMAADLPKRRHHEYESRRHESDRIKWMLIAVLYKPLGETYGTEKYA